MCKVETIKKIDAGTHVVVPKWWPWITSMVSPAVIIAFAFYFGGYKTDIEARSLDSAQQKEIIISHVEDNVRHLTFDEKSDLNIVKYRVNENSEKLDKIIEKLDIDD